MFRWYWNHCKRAAGLAPLPWRDEPFVESLQRIWSLAVVESVMILLLLLVVLVDVAIYQISGLYW
jgi:hypothetical protein